MRLDLNMLVTVKPGARTNRIVGEKDGRIVVEVAAPAEDGKANAELERFLTKQYKKRARIVSGFTSKRKTVLLEE